MRLGVDRPPAQFPFVDPMRCIGCGTCVDACPEGDVLGIVGGDRHGRERPALRRPRPLRDRLPGRGDRGRPRRPQVAQGHPDASTSGSRRRCPASSSPGSSGGLALVKNAIAQARKVVDRVAQLAPAARGAGGGDVLDLVIVGAGPAGLDRGRRRARARACPTWCSSRRRDLGGTIFHYPRRKLVLVQAVEVPILGPAPRGRVREGGPARPCSRTCAAAATSRSGSGSASRVSSAPRAVFSVRSTSGVTLGPAS